MITDEDRLHRLLTQAIAGDSAAYRTFLTELGAHLRAYFRRRLSRVPDEVEDLVQETLLAVHSKRHTYRQEMPLTIWVHAIAHYKLVDYLRHRRISDALNAPWDEDSDVRTASGEEALLAHHDVQALLETLPDRQRLPIQYVKLDGLSVSEAARRSGMSVSAVKVAVHRGLKLLASKVRERT